MKNARSLPVLALALGALLAPGWSVLAADPDYALIEKLPERETAAKKIAHEGWDGGVTPKMLDATNAYNDALTAMIADLAAAYYGKVKVTKEEVAAYARNLKAAAEFRHKLDNPTGEDRGTLDKLEAPSIVSSDLEDTLEQMVQAVTADSEKFDYEAWEKRWNLAKSTGDTDADAEADKSPEKGPEKSPEKAAPKVEATPAPATKPGKAD